MDELAAGFQFPSDRRSLPRSPWLVALGRQIIYACCSALWESSLNSEERTL